MYELKVRGGSDKTESLRKRALGNGACDVTTRIVSPNQDESIFIFRKNADFKKFKDWIQKMKDCYEVPDEVVG